MAPNFRTVVSNIVYVKACQVSRTLKGMIGSRYMEAYVKAVVLDSELRGETGAKRRTTWVKVRVVVASFSFDVWRPVGQLKEHRPSSFWPPLESTTPAAAPAAAVAAATGGREAAAAAAATTATTSATNTTTSTQLPPPLPPLRIEQPATTVTEGTSVDVDSDIPAAAAAAIAPVAAPVAAEAYPAPPPPPPPAQHIDDDNTTPISRLSGSTLFWHRTPTTVSGECKWFGEDEGAELEVSVNGPRTFQSKRWTLSDQRTDFLYSPGCDPQATISELEYFLAVFPIPQLEHMVRMTNTQLELKERDPIDEQGMLKFIGVSLLATRFEFGERPSL